MDRDETGGGAHTGFPPFFFRNPILPGSAFSPLTRLPPFRIYGIFPI